MVTRYGEISVPKSGPYGQGTDGSRYSPYLQDICLYAGAQLPYRQAAAMVERLFGARVSPATLQRLCVGYGEAVAERELDGFPGANAPVAGETVFAGVDGSMVHTDGSWHEAKLGRVWRPGGRAPLDDVTVRLQGLERFREDFGHKLSALTPGGEGLVFVSDGAVWIRDWISRDFPKAAQVLDWYHAVEHLRGLVREAPGLLPPDWAERAEAMLWEGRTAGAIGLLEALDPPEGPQKRLRDSLVGYCRANLYRMDYPAYRAKGWPIGSGAVEAAHKVAVHQRMRLSGQRWRTNGAQSVASVRSCLLNGNWDIVPKIIDEGRAAA